MRRKTRDLLEDMLLMVLENHQDIIASEAIDALTDQEANRIIDWAGVMHLEASDNQCRARCAPKCLRAILPADHYLQTWRVPNNRQHMGGWRGGF